MIKSVRRRKGSASDEMNSPTHVIISSLGTYMRRLLYSQWNSKGLLVLVTQKKPPTNPSSQYGGGVRVAGCCVLTVELESRLNVLWM